MTTYNNNSICCLHKPKLRSLEDQYLVVSTKFPINDKNKCSYYFNVFNLYVIQRVDFPGFRFVEKK